MKKLDKQAELIFNQVIKQVGDTLSTKRYSKSISARELNKLSGVSLAVISDLENYHNMPRVISLIKMALALDIPVSELFTSIIPEDIERNPYNTIRTTLKEFQLNRNEIEEVIHFIDFIRAKK